MKFIVGSLSKQKINSVERVLKSILPHQTLTIQGYNALSSVPYTPWDKETFDGARNRALDCQKNNKGDYFVGLESGLIERYGHIFEEAWCYILNNSNEEYCGYSSGLKVPDYITSKMKTENLKHYEVMQILQKENNLSRSDTWGNYSAKMIIRDVSLEEAIRNALIQIFSPQESLYRK